MKRVLVFVLIFMAFTLSVFAKGKTVKEKYEEKDIYKAKSDIYITDPYGEKINSFKSLVVGEPFYLHMDVTIFADKDWYEKFTPNNKVVNLDICFPKTKIFEIKLEDGDGIRNANIEPIIDNLNDTLTYSFPIRSRKKTEASMCRFIFKCTPISPGDARITLEFDDYVASDWDKLFTLTYINVYEE